MKWQFKQIQIMQMLILEWQAAKKLLNNMNKPYKTMTNL